MHLAGTLQPGQTATIDLAVADISTTSADYANFAAAVTAAITGRADLAFDPNTGTLTYTGTGSAMTDLVINLGAVDDTLVEGSEAYKLVLSNPGTTTVSDITLGTSEVITTITDNDTLALSLTGDTAVAEGGAPSYTLAITSGQIPVGSTATVDLSIALPGGLTGAEAADFIESFLKDLQDAAETGVTVGAAIRLATSRRLG